MARFTLISLAFVLALGLIKSNVSVQARIIKIVSENEIVEIDIEEQEPETDNDLLYLPGVADTRSDAHEQPEQEVDSWEEAEEEEEEESDDDVIGIARPCDPKRCKLPTCRCSGVDIPGGLKPMQTPQMIVLTFSNAIRKVDSSLYDQLFANRTNPNGCPATGTFFVSHNYSDYYEVQRLYSKRHELGDNGVSEMVPDFWRTATCAKWARQIGDQKKILSTFAGINETDIRGFRAPFLYMAGDNMFCGEKISGMKYDATRVELDSDSLQKGFYWPYTYDYRSTQPCVSGNCPNNSFPGVWQFPLAALTDSKGHPCSDLATCDVTTEDEAYDMLRDGFQNHYTTNRAPIMLQIKVDWLVNTYKMAATKKFLEMLSKYKDVYVVSAWQGLQWVQKPSSRRSHPAFSCDDPPPKVCKESNTVTCYYDKDRKFLKPGSTGIQFVMRMCKKTCPQCYPAVNDPTGSKC